jgi:hypothetical protein
MARYKISRPFRHARTLHPAGAVIDLPDDMEPSLSWKPLDAAAEAAWAAKQSSSPYVVRPNDQAVDTRTGKVRVGCGSTIVKIEHFST